MSAVPLEAFQGFVPPLEGALAPVIPIRRSESPVYQPPRSAEDQPTPRDPLRIFKSMLGASGLRITGQEDVSTSSLTTVNVFVDGDQSEVTLGGTVGASTTTGRTETVFRQSY